MFNVLSFECDCDYVMFYGKKEMTRVGLTESHELFKSGEIFHLAIEDRVIEFPSMLKV